MLTVQPALSITAFGTNKLRPEQINRILQKRDLTDNEIALLQEQDLTDKQLARFEELQYQSQYDEIDDQRTEFEKLANGKDFPLPKELKTVFKYAAIATTAILGGMAAGWGAGKTIKGVEKLNQSKFVKDTKVQLKALNKFIKETSKTVKDNFIVSDAYKLHQARLEKGRQSKFWGPILKFFGKVGRGTKFVYTEVKNATKFVVNKLKSVKPETYKKGTQHTVAVAGGVGTGAKALNDQNNSGD